jgi:hypothetical protein
MVFNRLEYIKNTNNYNRDKWAYMYHKYAYFQLSFREGEGVDNHVSNIPKGSIILSQNYLGERYLTHVVEVVNEASEDKLYWDKKDKDIWSIFRWVKVHWVADFRNLSSIPIDQNVMKAEWGWYDTKAKQLDSPSLMSEWENIQTLRAHLETVFK